MKSEKEKESEHISLLEAHCERDNGGACIFTLSESGILLHKIKDETLYLQDKTILEQQQKI